MAVDQRSVAARWRIEGNGLREANRRLGAKVSDLDRVRAENDKLALRVAQLVAGGDHRDDMTGAGIDASSLIVQLRGCMARLQATDDAGDRSQIASSCDQLISRLDVVLNGP